MDVLFLHPNFPGQFRQLAPALAAEPGWRVWAMGEADKLQPERVPAGVQLLHYPTVAPPEVQAHAWARGFEQAIRRGDAALQALARHKAAGLEPDVVIAHPGWGDAFFVRGLFPGARVVGYFEYYYRFRGADVGFDPEFPARLNDVFRLHATNATQLLALESCDVWVSPTEWQRSAFPAHVRDRMQVLHEGIDTDSARPDATATFTLPDGRVLRAGDEVLTYVARTLEPYRGFHVFMRALPQILRERPGCQVLVVGAEGQSYGPPPVRGDSWLQLCREQWPADMPQADRERVHFVGALPYAQYLQALQVSRAHVYLTYPFVLSWSVLEAMACGCVVLASDTEPVREVITDGVHGRLFGFFHVDGLARTAIEALAHPGAHAPLGVRARDEVLQRMSFARVALPAWKRLLEASL